MQIALIWAQARDSVGRPVIGAQGDIPWHLPEDFAHFKQLTAGHPVIMGERTWLSLPRKPLPNRTNIVLSPTVAPGNNPVFVGSLPDAFAVASQAPGGEVAWIIGGQSVYQQALEFAERLEVTEIDLEIAGDTFAPDISMEQFTPAPASRQTPWQVAANGLRYRFLTYLNNRDNPVASVGAN